MPQLVIERAAAFWHHCIGLILFSTRCCRSVYIHAYRKQEVSTEHCTAIVSMIKLDAEYWKGSAQVATITKYP